jgi:hypothetical protein
MFGKTTNVICHSIIPSNLGTKLDAAVEQVVDAGKAFRERVCGSNKKAAFTGRLDEEAIGKEGVSQERRSKTMSSRQKPARSYRRRRKAWERVEVIA